MTGQRILLVSTEPGRGGIGRIMDIQATALKDHMGCEVAFAYFARSHGEFYFRSDENKEEIYFLDEIGLAPAASSLARLLARIRVLRTIVRQRSFDVVIAHGEGAAFVTAGLAGQARTVAVLHSSITVRWEQAAWLRRTLYRWQLGVALRLHNRVVAVSRSLAQTIRMLPLAGRPVVIENCIDTSRIDKARRRTGNTAHNSDQVLRLVAVGRISREKNLPALLRIVAALRQERMALQLLVVGDGTAKTEFLQAVRASGLSLADLSSSSAVKDPADKYPADVVVTGFVGNPEAWLESADLFVMPSFTEGYPLAMIEALAMGVPVLASDCPSGPREIFELPQLGPKEKSLTQPLIVPNRGVLLPIPEAQTSDCEWIKAVRIFASEPSLRAKLVVNGKLEGERLGMERFAQLWAQVIDG